MNVNMDVADRSSKLEEGNRNTVYAIYFVYTNIFAILDYVGKFTMA